ncbi:MAG: type II secretion system protein GspE, partial [Desulfatitalea sp.]|nr:type II secretion system protein GspE [Desulfatitalea sp.]NNK01418.1 type II secretion system protein GspE [Desulfatitalea sp.]
MELAHILKHRFGIAEDQLADAGHLQQEKGGRLGDILLQREAVTEVQLLEALSIQYEIPFWPELPMENIMGDQFAHKISIQFLKRHNMVPMAVPNPTAPQTGTSGDGDGHASDSVYIIATNDPSNFNAVDDLARILALPAYKLVLSTRQAILAAINLAFDLSQDSAQQLVQDMEDESDIINQIEDAADLLEDTSDAPIIKLVNHV